jgi:hypothetical protein
MSEHIRTPEEQEEQRATRQLIELSFMSFYQRAIEWRDRQSEHDFAWWSHMNNCVRAQHAAKWYPERVNDMKRTLGEIHEFLCITPPRTCMVCWCEVEPGALFCTEHDPELAIEGQSLRYRRVQAAGLALERITQEMKLGRKAGGAA